MEQIECYTIDIKGYRLRKFLIPFCAMGLVLSFASVVTTRYGGKSIFEVYSAPTWIYIVTWLLMIAFLLFLLITVSETHERKILISRERILIEGKILD